MKLLLLYMFLIVSCLGQIRTNNLVRQWDMVTITGGVTITDLSGKGNNGTIVSGTPGSLGVTFNGSTDIVTGAAVLNNLNFTVMVCYAATANTGSGFMFGEVNAAVSANHYILLDDNAAGNSRVGSVSSALPNQINLKNDWHCGVVERSYDLVTFSIPDMDWYNTQDLAGQTVSTGFQTGLGGLAGTVPSGFWAGTIGYVVEWTAPLSRTDLLNSISYIKGVLAARGAPMFDVVTPVYPSGVWTRLGPIINNTPTTGYVEPSLLYTTTDCVGVPNPCFQMWASGTGTGANKIEYLESNSATGPWVVFGAVTSVSSATHPAVIKSGGLYYLYTVGSGGNIDLWTSSGPTAFSLSHASVIAHGSSAWDNTIWQKTVTIYNETWYMLYDAIGTGHSGFTFGGATSADGITWSKVGYPLPGWEATEEPCDGQLAIVNGVFYYWHAMFELPPHLTVTGRRSSTSFSGLWNGSSPFSVFGSAQVPVQYSLPTFESQETYDEIAQIADVRLLQVGSTTYMFYVAYSANGTSSVMKVAQANMPISQLVQTGEGAIQDIP